MYSRLVTPRWNDSPCRERFLGQNIPLSVMKNCFRRDNLGQILYLYVLESRRVLGQRL